MKNIFIVMLLVIAFVFASCSNAQLNNQNNNHNENNTNGNDIQSQTPSIPNTETPNLEMPDVSDDDILGNGTSQSTKAQIQLKTDSVQITGSGAVYSSNSAYEIYNNSSKDGGLPSGETISYGTVVEISESGTYLIQGALKGFISITKKDLEVTLILNGVNIFSESSAAIVCLKKSNVTIELAENSTNYLTDGGLNSSEGKYFYAYDSEEQANATLLIRNNLTIKGEGKLVVNAGLNNAIGSRGILTINGGTIEAYGVNNALKGNNGINITGGDLTIVSQADAIKTESSEEGLGYINISGGNFLITANNDAIQAATSLSVASASIKMKTGGGANVSATNESAKGFKSGTDLTIDSGYFEVDTNDDCIHSNGTVVINGGSFVMASADDGIHADVKIIINDCEMNLSKCYEGIESFDVDLNGGFIKLISTDDGVNISGGKDGSATTDNRPTIGGGRPGNQTGGGMGGQEQIIDGTLTINGGEYHITSGGDGLDSNGNMAMTGGTVVVFGPTSEPNVPIDYDKSFKMSGGTILAFGYMGNMAQQPDSSSTQYTFKVTLQSIIPQGSLINISTASGEEIATLKAVKQTRGVVVCSPKLAVGSYKICSGGVHTGVENRLGIYENGTYSGGTTVKSFNISSIVTNIN